MASLFLKGNKWYIQICEGGKKRQVSLRTSERKIAQFRKNEIENRMAVGDSPLAMSIVGIREAFDEFKKSRDGVLDNKTTRVVNQRIQAFIDDLGTNKLGNITESALKSHLDRRIAGAPGIPGISHKTANHSIQQIGTFLNFCLRRKWIKENPLRWMKRYRMDPVIPRFLAPDEAKKLLSAAGRYGIKEIALIALFTGMRWGEIARLKWEDFDLAKNEVVVRKSKTNKFRVIPIASRLRKELLRPGLTGPCIDTKYTTMDHRLTRLKNDLEIPHFRFHDLRHTFASMAIKSGVDLLTLSKWLGHSTVRTTELYAHLYNDHSQASMRRFCL